MKKKINLFYSKTNSKTKMNKRKRVVISKKKEETFFSACKNGNVEALNSLLLKYSANIVNQTIENRVTPLFIASYKGHVEVVSLLLNKGANVNQARKDGYTPLYIASQNGHINIVHLLLKFNGKLIF